MNPRARSESLLSLFLILLGALSSGALTAGLNPTAAAALLQACGCIVSVATINVDPGPACYASSTFVTQAIADGVCGNPGCSSQKGCSYDVTVTVTAMNNEDPDCDLGILLDSVLITTCTNCPSLTYSSTAVSDPSVFLECLTAPPMGGENVQDVYDTAAKTTGTGTWSNPARRTFTCANC